jgi:uncharacterized membrane protein YphA (DoxX/SURF4 family)
MEKFLKIAFNASRILLGLVFIFSGFVKGIDLLGSAYKFNEFFTVAGLPEFPNTALVMSYLLSTAEFLIGVALVTGVFINLTAWTAVFFMGFFFVLTFILAVFNPVSDCGCFGDAVKLSNWATFFKNVIFSLLVGFIFMRRKKFVFHAPLWMEWATVIITVIVFSSVSVYSYRHLPIIDFMPYSVGSSIPDKMKTPVDAPKDKYETTFKYRNIKSGDVKEFSETSYPWRDSINWTFVSSQTKLIKKGYTPPIHDFSITTVSGQDITDIILSDNSYSFLFVSSNLNLADPKGLIESKRIADFCSETGMCKFYAITSSISDDIRKVIGKYDIKYDFYAADQTTLKTIIRSNPGLILLKEGTVIGKWHYNDINKIILTRGDNFISQNLTHMNHKYELALTFSILLGLGLILAIIWALSIYLKNNQV